jgi:WD40 repeat protein
MMGQTILIRNADGDYTPAHRSLLEFLVAYKFAAEAGVLKADFVAAMQEQSDCIDRAEMPQDYTWTGYLQACVAAKCEKSKIPPLRGFIPESSEYIRNTFGREPLTKAVIDLIIPMLELKISLLKETNDESINSLIKIIHGKRGIFRLKIPLLKEINEEIVNPLIKIIHGTKGKTEAAVGWLGGNAATLLVKWNPAALDCEDLSHTQMANSDLVGANLQRVNFTGTNLNNSLFTSVLSSVATAISISQDGKFFATGHDDGITRFWDAIEGQLLYAYSGNQKSITAVAIETDKNWLVTGNVEGKVELLDISTGECLQTYSKQQKSVLSISIGVEKNCLIIGDSDGKIKFWNIPTGECLQTYSGHQVSVKSIAISPEENWFVTGDRDGLVKRWDILTGKCLQTYSRQSHSIRALAISPTGNWLIVSIDSYASGNWSLICWDIITGLYLKTYTEYKFSTFTSLAVATEENYLLSGSFDRTLKYWDISTGKLLQIYSGHQAPVTTLAISPNGNWFVSGSDDMTLRRWDISTGQCLQIYSGHSDWVWTVAISQKSDWFISGSTDRTLKRWDTLSGKCLQTYSGHIASISAVVISKDGHHIVSSAGGEIKTWHIQTGECIRTISNKPCGGMRIGGAIGLTSGQIESLKALGAVDD